MEIQKKAVAVITWNQDQLNHPLYALKIDPNVDSSLVVACLLLYVSLSMALGREIERERERERELH